MGGVVAIQRLDFQVCGDKNIQKIQVKVRSRLTTRVPLERWASCIVRVVFMSSSS